VALDQEENEPSNGARRDWPADL